MPQSKTFKPAPAPIPVFRRVRATFWVATLGAGAAAFGQDPVAESFNNEIAPLLDQYCYDCHGYGNSKGGVSLEDFNGPQGLQDHELWLRALKNLRSGIMPPAEEHQPTPEDRETIVRWIKDKAFALDPANPDPGRVTVRRLNRVEYRNTIRDLLDVDFDTQNEFPPDDTGHGFDNIADVLTISPMLLEKYFDAAQTIVAAAVPMQPKVVAERRIPGREFHAPDGPGSVAGHALELLYYTPAEATATHHLEEAGEYQIVVDLRSIETYVDNQFDYNRCRLIFKSGGETLLDQEFVREGDKGFQFTFDRSWAPGEHELAFEVVPLEPAAEQIRRLRFRINAVTVRGPLAPEHWVKPPRYDEFFPGGVPADEAARREYAQKLLGDFAARAFRRPVDAATVERLVALVDTISSQPGDTYESGIAQAMVAVLASPRFLFREEDTDPAGTDEMYAQIDEYSLASRLSYFLWSSMPDDELIRLAREGKLRASLAPQVKRLLEHPRSAEFVRNFTGQWLQARDIATVPINTLDVFLRENPNPALDEARNTFRELVRIAEEARTPEQKTSLARAREVFRGFMRTPKPELNNALRDAMQRETEMFFEHIVREDRSVLELIDSRYTFLNEALAKHYGIDGVTGPEMRKVALAADSPRGGVLTQGTVLAVTSNPTRTSPVKRGVFILDNILGTPPAPPPPNIPALEDAASESELRELSLRETLALHASNIACRSCHNRMDPLGLALENFNAMGVWRNSEMNQPIETAGELITGESFANIQELKRVLATEHRQDFYYCLSEKLLTYALGRGLEYYDTGTLDRLVETLEAADGSPSALLMGIVDSAPFQKRRVDGASLVRKKGHAIDEARHLADLEN